MSLVRIEKGMDMSRQTPAPGSLGAVGRDAVAWVILVVLSLCGVAIVWLCTMRYGPGLSPDSAGYISAARSLLAGNGYLYPDGQMYTQWPPLFPTLLAGLGLLGMDPLTGARVLNAVAFGLIVLLSGRLFARCTTTREFALLGTSSILISIPLLGVSVMVWSEPVFVVLTLLFMLYMPAFLCTGRLRSLILVAIFAGLACLERYAGITAVLAGSILILLGMSEPSILRRLKYLAGFCILSSSPLAVWFVRNRLIAGQTTGGHHLHPASAKAIWEVLTSAGGIVATWLFSPEFCDTTRWIGPVVAVAMMILTAILCRRGSAGSDNARLAQIRCVVVFGCVYFGFLTLSGAGLSWIPQQRHMSPMYVSFMLLAWIALEGGCKPLGRLLRNVPVAEAVCVALCILWLFWRLPMIRRPVAGYIRDGTSRYSSAAWQNSALIGWLRNHPLQGTVYSNAPDALYLLTGIVAEMTPAYDADLAGFAPDMSSRTSYIAWFHNQRRDYLVDLAELACRYEMKEVAGFPDGKIYQASGVMRPQPWSWAVYRFCSRKTGSHLYTIDKQQRDKLLRDSAAWIYEDVAFYAFREGPPGTSPVHHFRSERLKVDLYTISEAEKDEIERTGSNTWTYEDIVFYAYPERSAEGLSPVYRLRPEKTGGCFYTASEREKDKLINDGSHGWTDEGVAWYAYGP
jgi:hypothetical protein